MNKGCITIAMGLSLLILLGGVGLGLYLAGQAPALFLLSLEEAIQEYQTAHPSEEIPWENAAWCAVLASEPSSLDRAKLEAHIQDGAFVDADGASIEFTETADGKRQLVSAGKDGQLGTPDDVTAESLPNWLQNWFRK